MKIKVNNQKLLKKGGGIPKYWVGGATQQRPKLTIRTKQKMREAARQANNPKQSAQPQSTRLQNQLFVMRTGNKEQKAAALSQYYRDKGDLKQAEIYAKASNYYRTGAQNPSKQQSKGTTGNPQKPINPRGRRNKTTPVKTITQTTTTQPTAQPTTVQPTTTTISAPMYQNLLSDMTIYKNNPDTFIERFGNLNGNYTGFASKTPGQQYATSINDMTDEARTQYLQGLNGLYDMYQKDPTEAINYAKYNFFVPQNNATVGDYAQAQLNSTKPQNNISPAFYNQITNWYANNKPTIDNYFNSNINYSQDFNQRVQNFLDKYKQYRPKYTFAKKGSKLIQRNK